MSRDIDRKVAEALGVESRCECNIVDYSGRKWSEKLGLVYPVCFNCGKDFRVEYRNYMLDKPKPIGVSCVL